MKIKSILLLSFLGVAAFAAYLIYEVYSFYPNQIKYGLGRTDIKFIHGECIRHRTEKEVEFMVESNDAESYRLIDFSGKKLNYIVEDEYTDLKYVNHFFKKVDCGLKLGSLGKDPIEKPDPKYTDRIKRYRKDLNH